MTITISTVLGCGLCAAGVSPAGFGTPSTVTEPNRNELVIDEGPYKNQTGNCRLIDPVTQDYRFNSNGYMVGGNGIQQLVYLSLLTVKNSSAQLNLGQNFSSLKVIGTNYKEKITNEVQLALSDLISQKKIKLTSVDVLKENNMLRLRISWTDLTTQKELTNII